MQKPPIKIQRKIPDEYFIVLDKEPGDQPWTNRPWRHLTARDVPLGSIIASTKKPEHVLAQVRVNPSSKVQSVTYKQFSATSHGTGSGDLLQEMPEKRREGFNLSKLHFVTGSTTFSRLHHNDSVDQLMRHQLARTRLLAGQHLFLVTGTMVADGECKFTTLLDGKDWSETYSEDRVDKHGLGRRLLGLKLLEVWAEGPEPGRISSKPYRPTSGYVYGYEEDRVEGVYTVLDDEYQGSKL